MALLSDTDPDATPRSTVTLCCDSTVGAYKHRNPKKKERREKIDRMRRSGFHVYNQYLTRFQADNRSSQSWNPVVIVPPLASVFNRTCV